MNRFFAACERQWHHLRQWSARRWVGLGFFLAAGYFIIGILVPGLPLFADPLSKAGVQFITLQGPMTQTRSEGSGLAWYKDNLFLVPQFPHRMFRASGGALFTLTRAEIEAYLDGERTGALEPRAVPMNTKKIQRSIRGFEGFEAVTFYGEQIYLLIEAHSGTKMTSYIIRGTIEADLSKITLDEKSITEVPVDHQRSNYSNESITVIDDRLLVFHELNGSNMNPEARAYRYTLDLQPDGWVKIPNIPYRVTDATEIDDQGRFWVMNYFFPVEYYLYTLDDPLRREGGRERMRWFSPVIERIVELQVSPDTGNTIILSGRAPFQLKPSNSLWPRNWEGLARLDGRGFLLLTDRYPLTFGNTGTIFAFIPYQP
jgi:hypothetical protein